MSNPKNFNKNVILKWMLLFLAILQSSAQLLNYFIQGNVNSMPFLLNIWITLGSEITKNWIAFSISLFFWVLGCLLYNQIFDNEEGTNLKKDQLNVIGLLIINLALCNQIYSTTSISEKANYITAHLSTAIVIAIMMLLGVIGIWMISNEHNIAKEIKKFPPPDLEHEKENNTEDTKTPTTEKMYMWENPSSYNRRMNIYYSAVRRKIKHENKMKFHIINRMA